MVKLLSFVVALAMVQSGLTTLTIDNPNCNDDNCARGVTGTRPGKLPVESSRVADCSSFQLTVVTPAPKTTTVHTTVTKIPPHKRDGMLEDRQVTVTPVTVPTYASACSGAVRYKSACSCWGITAAITTAPTPTVTVISTVTVTPNECSNPGTKCGTFHGISNPACGPSGSCLCVTDTDGRAVCVEDFSCSSSNKACTKDADCPGVQVCWATGCCTGGGLCAVPANVCPFAPVKMLRMFRRELIAGEVEKRNGCTNAGCT